MIGRRKRSFVALESELAQLREELATYRHAFETTRDDRDRIKAILDAQDQVSKQPLQMSKAQGADPPPQATSYGSLWGRVAEHYDQITGGGAVDQQAFEAILKYGGFSQYVMYSDRDFLEALIDWQIGTFGEGGVWSDSLSDAFAESEIMPAHLRFERAGRQVSADFLRLLSYVQTIRRHAEPGFAPELILEIGSGYGGLARLLKATYPAACVCLVDIPACLRAAEYFLRESLPSARLAWIDDPRPGLDPAQADFLFVPADKAEAIEGQTFDLAVNTWSFGEMPNAQIRLWFDLLQKRNRADRLFLLNHFMAPVRLTADNLKYQASHYSWITDLDRAWQISYFEIDPPIEQPPLIRHKHRGIALFARRLESSEDIADSAKAAAEAADEVHLHDWVRGSLAGEKSAERDPNAGRRALLTRPVEQLTDGTKFVLDAFDRSLGLWRPDLDRTECGTFFRLWNDIRMNGSPLSVRLLRIWLHLHWRPVTRSAMGAVEDMIFREELIYGLSPSGQWIQDDHLEIPDWLKQRMERLKS